MNSEFQSIAMLRKKFEKIKNKPEKEENEAEKSVSAANLFENNAKTGKLYESLTNEKLIKIIKSLRKENKVLKKINERQAEEIKDLIEKLHKKKGNKEGNSPRPVSCLRTSNSVPKKNRVMFSRDLVHVMNEKASKNSKTMKTAKHREEQTGNNNATVKKISKKMRNNESASPNKEIEESEYYTPLSSSLQEKKFCIGPIGKHFEFSPKGKQKQKTFIKVARF
jgi:hypothetical protein